MRFIFCFTLVLNFLFSFSQDSITNNSITNKKWLRIGVVYGFASQNTVLKQDSDYTYETTVFKISSHFSLYKRRKHSFEFLIEPSYYKSQHKSLNYWHEFYTSSDTPDVFRERYMKLKDMNEYVLNLGLIYRYYLKPNFSAYVLGNVGPMYIDTDTEMLRKGFAFSDIFALGANYKINKISFDFRTMIRHVSNANLQKPNYGLNSVGFEFGAYYEFN